MKIANPTTSRLGKIKTNVGPEKATGLNIFAERVEKKAYELYEKRGCQHGRDFDDWLEAERIVEKEMISGR